MTQSVEFNSSGVAVFAGTRVPVVNVTASLDAGMTFERVQDSWPFLTPELVEAGRAFAEEHGSAAPPRVLDVFPNAVVVSRTTVRRKG